MLTLYAKRAGLDRISVLIVDDSPEVIESLKSILRSHADVEVVGTAVNGLEALAEAQEIGPNVILMDAQMPGMDGVETTRQLKELVPDAKILFMAVHANHIDPALDAGADGFMMKDAGRQELLHHIRNLGRRNESH